jgi:hypothetical protein
MEQRRRPHRAETEHDRVVARLFAHELGNLKRLTETSADGSRR